MKKFISVFIAILLVIGLCSCKFTFTEPEEVVNDFFQAIKTKNEDVLILYTKNEDINMLLHSTGSKKDLELMYESLFKNYSYKIVTVTKNEEETEAEAKVNVANADFSKVLEKYQKKAYQYMEDNLYSGKLSKKELNEKCMNFFAKQVKEAAKNKNTSTKTLTVKLVKNDNYSWDMELTEEMMSNIMGGLIIPL